MAIEKMVMMNVIGDISYVDNVLKDLILLEEVDLISALSQIEENSFVFNVQDKNLEKAIDLNYISPFPKDRSYEELLEKGKKLKQMLDIEDEKSTEKLKEKLDFPSISLELNNIYEEVKGPYEQLKLFKEELVKADKLYDNFSLLKNINIPIEELRDLSYFDFRFGILSKEDQIKLKKNYNNILAIVLHTGNSKEGEVYLVMYPSSLREELSRVLRSLNFKGILIPEEYTKTPMEMLEFLESKKVQLKDKIDILGRTLLELKNKYEVKVQELINGLCMKERIEDCKEYMASSKKFFYLSGWVSKKSINKVEKVLNKYEGILTMYKEKDEVIGFIPPTKLKNIKLFKPFEYLVKMYGIPSYNEIDPTGSMSIFWTKI
jgi:V/A-type H+-transporting ATPase subunit I